MDTPETLIGRVQQRVGLTADYFLILDWLQSAWRDDLLLFREWSWRKKFGQFIFNAVYSTGTITINRGEYSGVTVGSTLTQAMVGRQLRAGGNEHAIVTITRIDDDTIYFDHAWGGPALTAQSFEIYNAYLSVPQDFDSFISVVDLERGFQLNHWSWSAADLDKVDPQRSRVGDTAYAVVFRDMSADYRGVVEAVIQARGSGNVPVSGGEYTGVIDAVFTIEMTDADTFKWKKGAGSYVTGVDIDAAGAPQHLQDGVGISFPTGVAYTSGDIFVIAAKAQTNPGVARYECWPHIQTDETRPYLYLSTIGDLADPGFVIPRYIHPGYLLEKALAACARWKHPDNKYFDLKLSAMHELNAQRFLLKMEIEDQSREQTDIKYDDDWSHLPIMGGDYLVDRDLGYD